MTPINWRQFTRSVGHAVRGLGQAASAENSFRIHGVVALVVLVLLAGLRVPADQSALVIMVIASMLILELVNTVVERFADLLEPRVHPYVRIIKDLMAAAVFIAAVTAILVGGLVFWPYLRALLGS